MLRPQSRQRTCDLLIAGADDCIFTWLTYERGDGGLGGEGGGQVQVTCR